MNIIKASKNHLSEILDIYASARAFMAEHGNPSQWGNSYPPKEQVIQDIEQGKCYICVEKEQIQCVFYYAVEEDPTYAEIDGAWLNKEEYAVVHRIASAKGIKGAATFCLNWAYEQHKNVKIDTHDDNIPMQNLLKKLGFQYCGRITLADGSERIAFQKI